MSTELFQISDAITQKVSELEAQLAPEVGAWVWEPPDPRQDSWGVAKYGSKFRIVHLSKVDRAAIPVNDCRLELRIAFGLISVDFWNKYRRHAELCKEDLHKKAKESLAQISSLFPKIGP